MKNSFRSRRLVLTTLVAVSACTSAENVSDSTDESASVSIALSTVPSGVSCGIVTVSVGSDSRRVSFGLGTNRPTTVPLRQLPLGSATFHADAFEDNCESVTTDSVPAWISDDVTRTLRPGHNPDVALTLHPNANGSVSISFDPTPPDLSGPWWIEDGNTGGDNPTIDPILPCGPTKFLGWDATIGKPGLDGHVWDLEPVDGGSAVGPGLYACGEFTTAGGVAASKIAKWDGTNWSAVGGGLDGGDCTTLEVGPDHRLYVGGTFTSAGGIAAHHLASWDGSNWLALPAVDNTPYDLHFHTYTFDDGLGGLHTISDLYVAGDLTTVGGVTVANDLGRLRALNYSTGLFVGGGEITDDGFGRQAPDPSYRIMDFDNGTGFKTTYVGGTSFQDPIHAGNPDPDRWAFIEFVGDSPFFFHHLGMGNADPSTVFDLVPYKGSLFGLGTFARPNNHESSNIFQFGNDFTGVTHGVDDVVRGGGVADVGDGEALYIGGSFTHVDRHSVTHNGASIPALHVARWNGSTWRRLGPGVGPADNQPIEQGNHAHVLRGWDAADGDGTSLYVAGRFTVAGDIGANNIARWGCREPDSSDRVDLGPLTWAPLGDIGPAVSFQIGADGIPTAIECADQTIPIGPNVTVSACGWSIVTGSDGDDTIDVRRSTTGTVIFGGLGNDNIQGSSFRDVIFGDGGNDVIDGNDGNDRILGGGGADVIRGGNGDDAIAGGPGDDSLEGGDGFDYFDATSGIDDALDPADGDVVQR
jgi:hypothetical protein